MKKLFLSISSFSWVIYLYLLQKNIWLFDFSNKYLSKDIFNIAVYGIICMVIGILSVRITIWSTKKQSDNNLTINKIHPIYSEYMPIYLTICVIVLGLNDIVSKPDSFTSTICISVFIFLAFYISNIAYLNPVWYLYGKRVYKVENSKGNYILILNKKDNYKSISNIENIAKVSEYVFMKKGE